MNFYKVVGQITAKTSKFLSNIGFKNIVSFTINSDDIDIVTTEGVAQIRYNSPGVRGVYWSVADFEHQAKERWEFERDNTYVNNKYSDATCWQDVYDENKFEEALDRMVNKHDASIGITWDTIDFWLNEMCLQVTIIDMIEKLYPVPVIRAYKGYAVLGQSLADAKSKMRSIDKGDTYGFYTLDEIKKDYYEENQGQTDTN